MLRFPGQRHSSGVCTIPRLPNLARFLEFETQERESACPLRVLHGTSLIPSSIKVTLLSLRSSEGLENSFQDKSWLLFSSLRKMRCGFLHIAMKVKTGFIMLGIEEEFCNSPQRRSIGFLSFPLTTGIDDSTTLVTSKTWKLKQSSRREEGESIAGSQLPSLLG